MTMRIRTALLAATVLVTGVGAVAPALAKPKTTPTSYTAHAPTPDPTPVTGETGGNCHPTHETAMDNHPFKVPAAGNITIDLTGFQGDWALGLFDSNGDEIATDDQDVSAPIDTPAHIEARFKKAETVTVRACNFSGGPTANVKIKYVTK
jgi:hypothetical protein